jgi:hypothetical protein
MYRPATTPHGRRSAGWLRSQAAGAEHRAGPADRLRGFDSGVVAVGGVEQLRVPGAGRAVQVGNAAAVVGRHAGNCRTTTPAGGRLLQPSTFIRPQSVRSRFSGSFH